MSPVTFAKQVTHTHCRAAGEGTIILLLGDGR